MQDLIKKENAIFGILQRFIDLSLDFIVVGGYAVSSYKHRFSVDADIVLRSTDLEKFETALKKEGFKKGSEKLLQNIYSSKYMRYENDDVSVDLLIDALASRTTDAAFSYNLLLTNSILKKIIGIEKEVQARIPIKELLIVMKIHSGRLTDFRDIAALAKDTDLSVIKKFLFIGNLKVVQDNLGMLQKIVHDKNFVNSFKGVFIEKKFDIDLAQVERISKLRP